MVVACSGRSGVYPRACGGAWAARAARRLGKGLSPRVRGSHPDAIWDACCGGSIPARAGEPKRCDRRTAW